MSVYTVKGVKYHKGHEGEELPEGKLCRDGKVVAEFSGGDWGSEMDINWLDRQRVTGRCRRYDGKSVGQQLFVEEAKLWDHIWDMKLRPSPDWPAGKEIAMSPDVFIEDLINDMEERKQLKKCLKKWTLYRLKDRAYKRGEWSVGRVQFTPAVALAIRKKFGDRLNVVLNEQGEDYDGLQPQEA